MAHLINASRRGGLVCLRQSLRCFSTPVESPKPSESSVNATASVSKNTHKVDNFEKKLLVWSGKYKNSDEVPPYVNQDVMERARNKFRIRAANIMMFLTFVGCGIMIFSGKKASEKGESVQKMNLDWHKEYNEKAQQEALAKNQK